MNSLVAYESSDDEDNVQPEKPAETVKVAPPQPAKQPAPQPAAAPAPQPALQSITPAQPTSIADGPLPGPAAGPAPAAPVLEPSEDTSFDPYAFERQRLRELTMPTLPNFDIPDSPPPPTRNSEEAAVLAATTKKLERFLELKKQGVHFNDRLQNTTSLRNPSLLPKLMEFAGLTREDGYASSLSEDVAVPVKWPEECYIEALVQQNERREKKRLRDRDHVDFVPAKSGGSSASGTPAGSAGPKKSKFDAK
ncbi:hypothetical protein CKM354_001269100 [Cercospora kikuchii]|uniref:HCNGP-like protein n=1 Tax=Cercospora kikuchii TaxID=84275 RepID=A0A9P3L255_9PEZI|nr:uncharacterized protein CKM354_001269100 [Cercospora kikuchii]GIZ49663.1 hypothetical protein CKM354_001269100 [Cercospora kikuchii]